MSQRHAANAARQAARPRVTVPAQIVCIARACAISLSSALCAFAQAPEASGIERLVAADAARALWSDAPECRGEAALIVAADGDPRFERRLLELAADEADIARRRALIALGLLATPSAIAVSFPSLIPAARELEVTLAWAAESKRENSTGF